jgi:hypothetical protein
MVSTTPANRALMELAELAVRALPGLPTPLVTPS